jgi:cytochrome o ubiquinol oxidase subunit I
VLVHRLYLAFMPLYVLGLMGMTRRMQHYDNLAWQPWLVLAAVGVVIILAGIVCQIIQLAVSIRTREQHRDLTGDPWNGRTLEWSTASPPPAWNFAVLPQVSSIDAYWSSKQQTRGMADQSIPTRAYQSIELPKNSPLGFVTAFFAVVICFALIWHIWWLVILGLFGVFTTLLVFAFRDEEEIEISAEQIARFERHAQTGAA